MNPGDVGQRPGHQRVGRRRCWSRSKRFARRFRALADKPVDGPVTSSASTNFGVPEQDTAAYRPSLRPSMALLYVLDDGDDTGEVMRVRANSFRHRQGRGKHHDTRTMAECLAGMRRSAGGIENGEHTGISKTCKAPTGLSCGRRPSS